MTSGHWGQEAAIDRRTGLASLAALPAVLFANGEAAARLPSSGDARLAVASLTDGREDESALLRAACSRLRDGGTLEISGRWLLASAVAVAGLSNVTIVGIGAQVKLAARAWRGTAALIFRDCSALSVRGLSFDCSGGEFLALNVAPVPGLAIISTAANGGVTQKRSHDVFVDCCFEDCATRGLAVRLVDGLTVRGRFRRKAWNSHFVEIARCNRVDVAVDCDAGLQERTSDYGGNVVVSPGPSVIADAEAEMSTFPALNAVAGVPAQGAIDWRSPFGEHRGTFSYADAAEIVVGGDYSSATWFFSCYDANGAENVRHEQISVVAIDQTRKQVTVELRQLGGEQRTFAGQRFRITGITLDRFCRDIRIHDCTLSRASGCGVFLLACDGFQIVNCSATDNLDSGLNVEWCINGLIADNVVTIRERRSNIGISALYFTRNVRISGNVITCASARVGILHHSSGQVSGGLCFSSNNLVAARIECHGFKGAQCIVDGLIVERNLLQATGSNAIALDGGGSGCLKRVAVRDNQIIACGADPITVSGIHELSITGQVVECSEYRGLLSIGGTGAESSRIEVHNNRVRQGGYQWSKLPLVKFTGTGTPPAVTFAANSFLDDDGRGGVHRDLYQDAAGVPLPALRPGEARISWEGGTLGSHGRVQLPLADVPQARPGDPVIAWALADLPDILITARCFNAGQVAITLANPASAGVAIGAIAFGVLVPA